jgi:hypothetical protein
MSLRRPVWPRPHQWRCLTRLAFFRQAAGMSRLTVILMLSQWLVVAACLYLKKRRSGRDVSLMLYGSIFTICLELPGLFVEIFGSSALVPYSDALLGPEESVIDAESIHFPDSASRLVAYCGMMTSFGISVFAWGLWRHAGSLAASFSPNPVAPE